jgi:ribonuclease G
MGGIIVVDFIDLSNPKIVKSYLDSLEMSDDKAKHKSYPQVNGLVKSHDKVRPEILKQEEDPNDVNGEIEAPILIIDKIISDLEEY